MRRSAKSCAELLDFEPRSVDRDGYPLNLERKEQSDITQKSEEKKVTGNLICQYLCFATAYTLYESMTCERQFL